MFLGFLRVPLLATRRKGTPNVTAGLQAWVLGAVMVTAFDGV